MLLALVMCTAELHLMSVCLCVFFTLILFPSAARSLQQALQQEGLEDFRAAMESSKDVQQPPTSLAAITVQHKSAQILSGLQAWGRKRSIVWVGLWCVRG